MNILHLHIHMSYALSLYENQFIRRVYAEISHAHTF